MENYYRVLGIDEKASEAEIKSAYRNLVKKYHPDSSFARQNPSEATEQFEKITEAYKVLCDAEKKSEYDRNRSSLREKSVREQTPAEKAKALYRDGRRAYKLKNFDRASALFRYAVELETQNALYCSWLGLSLLEQHRGKSGKDLLHEAREWCWRATRLSPSNPDYYVNLALVCAEAGERALAGRYLRQAVSISPGHNRARLWLERLGEGKGNGILKKIRMIFKSVNGKFGSF